ncbi:MAG TPA: Holliday junction resolvase RuvX [Gemmatales bacterium]|nr:Holliday junction resolvase RuvX [Gemmatales bacterium]HMP15572.1 Holliday junction resolvase RuvX [Gemmatales bacterium]
MSQEVTPFVLPPGPLLGIDYGSVRLGLAISDRDQCLAAPFQLIQRLQLSDEAAFYLNVVAKEKITGIVLGLPVHLSSQESSKSKEVKRYGNWLTKLTGVPVVYWDERYSTTFAWETLKASGLKASERRKQLDKVAAQMILQSYLDFIRNHRSDSGVVYEKSSQPVSE